MTEIKSTTKKGKQMLNRAGVFEGVTLPDVYGTVSPAKTHAWRECLFMCQAENGADFHICSHNSFTFSVAWLIEKGVHIETAQNSYLILFPEYC